LNIWADDNGKKTFPMVVIGNFGRICSSNANCIR
jgi:hypothetical protein